VGNTYNVSRQTGYTSTIHAFVWKNGVMTDLNKLIPSRPAWTLLQASDINNAGQIVGRGVVGTGSNPVHAYLLKPPGAALKAATLAQNQAAVAPLTVAQVQPLLAEAINRWVAAAVNPTVLGNIRVVIADLPERQLGFASGHTVLLDPN